MHGIAAGIFPNLVTSALTTQGKVMKILSDTPMTALEIRDKLLHNMGEDLSKDSINKVLCGLRKTSIEVLFEKRAGVGGAPDRFVYWLRDMETIETGTKWLLKNNHGFRRLPEEAIVIAPLVEPVGVEHVTGTNIVIDSGNDNGCFTLPRKTFIRCYIRENEIPPKG